MKTDLSTQFKNFFLLEFTRELIRNSQTADLFKLREILRDRYPELIPREKKLNKFEIQKRVGEIMNKPHLALRESSQKSFSSFSESREPKPLIRKKMLRVPEPRLPQRFRNLAPVGTSEEIDVGKLNPLVLDRNVQVIEFLGGSKNVAVSGSMGKKNTSIILSKEEVDSVINKFLAKSKIPRTEGVIKVVVGKLVLTAKISNAEGSSFSIKKIQSLGMQRSRVPMPPMRK